MLRKKHPALDVHIPPLNDTDELLTELRAGRIDAALVARPATGASTRIVWHDVHRQPYVLLAPADAMQAEPRAVLKTYGWLAYDTALPGGRIAARLARSLVPGITSNLALRSMDAIVSMVSLSMGASILPRPRQQLLAAYGVKQFTLGRAAPFRRICLVWRRADDGNRKIAAVVEAFEQR